MDISPSKYSPNLSKAARRRRNKRLQKLAMAKAAASEPMVLAKRKTGSRVKPKTAAGNITVNTPFGGGNISWLNPAADVMGVNTRADRRVGPRYRLSSVQGAEGEWCDRLEGSDAVSAVNIEANKATGDILLKVKISPLLFPETRLAQLAPLYERFRFRKLYFEYAPVASSFNSGQILGFYDPDSDADWASSPDNFSRGAAMAVHEPNQISQRQIWVVNNPQFTNMFTNQDGSDARLQQQGQFIVMANSTLSSAATPSLGNLYVWYDIEMYSPQLGTNRIIRAGYLIGSSSLGTKPFGSTVDYAPEIFHNVRWTDESDGINSIFQFTECLVGGTFNLTWVSSYTGTYSPQTISAESGLDAAIFSSTTSSASNVVETRSYPIAESAVVLKFIGGAAMDYPLTTLFVTISPPADTPASLSLKELTHQLSALQMSVRRLRGSGASEPKSEKGVDTNPGCPARALLTERSPVALAYENVKARW